MSKILFKTDEETTLKAYQLFGKSQEDVEDYVIAIKEWFKNQPHLPEIMGDSRIKNFLVLNKFSIEKTKQKIDMYYTIRSLIPDWFDQSNPKLPKFQTLAESCVLAPLPNRFDKQYQIFYYKTTKPGKLLPEAVLLEYYNTFEIRLQDDCIIGDIFIVDYSNYSMDDYIKLTPAYFAKAFMILQFHVHKDDAILKKIFPDDFIPSDYGGKGPCLIELNSFLKQRFQEFEKRFDLLDQLRVNEDLRPPQLENDDNMGYHGNFKRLNVD